MIYVHDYRTGDLVREATPADLEAARDCDPATGVFSEPETGKSRYLEGCGFDGQRYDFIADE